MHTRENITKTIMHCRVSTPKAIELPTRLEFNQHDLIMTKEQLVLTKRIKEFASEEILLQHSLSSYKIDLYFPGHKLAIEVDNSCSPGYISRKTLPISPPSFKSQTSSIYQKVL